MELEKLVGRWRQQAGFTPAAIASVHMDECLQRFARLAMAHAAEEAAKCCEERAAGHEEDATAEPDSDYADRFRVYAKHERRCADAIRERFKA
jgi:hypothetical protein